MRKNKLLLLLALLLTAATGAWAQEETLLTTIVNTGDNASFIKDSKTFDNIATVTFSGIVVNENDNWGWYSDEERTLTVTAAEGYTITRVKFYTNSGSAFDEEAPFEAILVFDNHYIAKVNGTSIGKWGVNKIEVYGYAGTPAAAGYSVTMKDGVKDAGKWTVKVGEGEAQALPIGGLKGDGTETVTLQYNGRLKVKGVKATSDAAPAGPKAANDATAEDLGKVIGADGNIYDDADAATAAKTTAVAKICYVGSDNGEAAPYNHGLALALSDANGGSSYKWKTSNTDAGHTKWANSTFTSESGLQYNDATHNSETYPAFKAAITYSPAAPTGCSAWFLASGYQWKKMIDAVGLSNLGLTGDVYYWSSSEYNAYDAWDFNCTGGAWYNSGKNYADRVRACLAF